VRAASEAVDVTDVADEAGGAGRADAVEVLQAAAGRFDEFGEFLVRRFDLLVHGDQVADQLGREPAPGAPDEVAGPDGVEQGAGLVGGQELLRPAGQQLEQEFVDAVEQVGAGVSEAVAAVDQQPQRDRHIIDRNLANPLARNAATATLCASTGSVLRARRVAESRAPAGSYDRTSTSVSPAATRRGGK